ncbi:hypothetical protein DFP72DRAFT_373961 [Ephemerocybe angulata]|uniref:Uncharacterized protein n=1 Tax=Ephemerocybe angulata TaxID=980116 RepID=A0A8H6HX46_9AGAR|nr:hypothetical protein DFP72DRAFT_373961 [Tulosesus angulatus]
MCIEFRQGLDSIFSPQDHFLFWFRNLPTFVYLPLSVLIRYVVFIPFLCSSFTYSYFPIAFACLFCIPELCHRFLPSATILLFISRLDMYPQSPVLC